MQIAIIGGGATGALLVLSLVRTLPPNVADIVLIEPNDCVGRGVAYATTDPGHLLNVRVANMSAFVDQPEHLLHWLQHNGPAHGVTDASAIRFIPRKVYGTYIADMAGHALQSASIRHVKDRCENLIETDDCVTLHLASGATLQADYVVLATGHDAKPTLSGIPAEQPWGEHALSDLPPDAPVLILGTGLTMVDMVLSLDRRGHRGPITAVSRRGLLGHAHRDIPARQVPEAEIPFGAELSVMLAWLRQQAETMAGQGADWRSAIDALRPHTQRLWQTMSPVQKRRFLRHARAYWDIHRHRMAPEIEARLNALRAAGHLTIMAGRISKAEKHEAGITVHIIPRGRSQTQTHQVARLIDCTGLADDPRNSSNPLIRNLLGRGAIRLDPLGIGLDIADGYELIDDEGGHSNRVYAIGPLARAAFWECIAIPDIRLQCQDLGVELGRRIEKDQGGFAPLDPPPREFSLGTRLL
jgi:uncharacterized NAD(P)/FAD-binding protein YdhS